MENLITTKEAAEIAGVDEATIRKWCAAGKLPARRLPGHRGLWLIERGGLADVKRSAAGRKPAQKLKNA